MNCIVCARKGYLVTLPLVGKRLWLCRIHGSARMIATMRTLTARG